MPITLQQRLERDKRFQLLITIWKTVVLAATPIPHVDMA